MFSSQRKCRKSVSKLNRTAVLSTRLERFRQGLRELDYRELGYKEGTSMPFEATQEGRVHYYTQGCHADPPDDSSGEIGASRSNHRVESLDVTVEIFVVI